VRIPTRISDGYLISAMKSAYHSARRVGARAKRRARELGYRWDGVRFAVRNVALAHRPLEYSVDNERFQLTACGLQAFSLWTRRWTGFGCVELIYRLLDAESVFVDAGANAGLFTVAVAKFVPRGRVYAFEPCPSTFNLLDRNVKVNRLRNVRTFQLALGNHRREASLTVSTPRKAGSQTLERPSDPNSQPVGAELAPVTSLDEFLDTERIGRVDVLKVDVKGAERLVFEGAQRLLKRDDAPVVMYEGVGSYTSAFHYHPVETMWYLQNCGFHLFSLDKTTGRVSLRSRRQGYDGMILAVKSAHPSYEKICEAAGCA
jgi:FkbM family methyltransferase